MGSVRARAAREKGSGGEGEGVPGWVGVSLWWERDDAWPDSEGKGLNRKLLSFVPFRSSPFQEPELSPAQWCRPFLFGSLGPCASAFVLALAFNWLYRILSVVADGQSTAKIHRHTIAMC